MGDVHCAWPLSALFFTCVQSERAPSDPLHPNGTGLQVKANILGTEFTIYDSGLNPKKAEKGRQSKDFKDVRKELGMVKYDRNVFGWSGPRQMAIILPALNEHQVRRCFAREHNFGAAHADVATCVADPICCTT